MNPSSTFGWNVKDKIEDNDDFAEIELYGEVTSHQLKEWNDDFTGLKNAQCICPEGFLDALKNLEGKKNVLVRLNTCGGDAVTGLWIYNRLKSLDANITVIVESMAASAGSIIAMAASSSKQRKVYSASDIMVHGVSAELMGSYNVSDLKKVLKMEEAFNQMLVNVFVSATGQSEEKVRGWLERETHFVGQDAVDNGFADEVIDGETSMKFVACAKGNMIVDKDGHAIKADFFIPERVKQLMTVNTGDVADDSSIIAGDSNSGTTDIINDVKNSIKNKGGVNMDVNTVEELKKNYPELCNALVAEAIKDSSEKAVLAERERIKQIDSIAFKIADKALIEKAKFEGGATAADLLMQDALAEKERNAKIVQQIDNDAKNSGTNDVRGLGKDPILEVEDAAKTGAKSTETKRAEAVSMIQSILGGNK